MAEAPEVEVLAQDLRRYVAGRPITAVRVLDPAAVRFPAPDAYAALLVGRTIAAATRWAKHLWLPLAQGPHASAGPDPASGAPSESASESAGESAAESAAESESEPLLALEIHLMLFGTLLLLPTPAPYAPQTLIAWTLDRGQDLRLLDRLAYARSAAGPAADLIARLDLAALGPDALDPGFSAEALHVRLHTRRAVLKTVLLNQRVVAGLGNRDADESLWLAAIDPRRSASSLTPEESQRLHAAMTGVLQGGLALRGTQRDLLGVKGGAPHGRYVFERSGRPCQRCGAAIAATRIGGRNTHFCPNCQR
jgi:formamidopyrimidine-DNA glycosylase